MGVSETLERLLLQRSAATGLRVVETVALTPHMRRVQFEGQDLTRFADHDNLHVRLMLPPDRAPRRDWLEIDRAGLVIRSNRFVPLYRKYTIRSIAPDQGRVSIDFVLHGDAGPGSAWASRAAPGDVVGMIGPGGLGIATADHYLIAGDETALPAIARILEILPASATGDVVIEVGGAEDELPLHVPPSMILRWVHRGSAPGDLPGAIAALGWQRQGRAFAWIGAEFAAVRDIRRHLEAQGMARKDMLAVAYWRRQGPARRD